jgi:hypothetical protein
MRSTIRSRYAGETVARAKRTERAEARRRYRASTATDSVSEADEGPSHATNTARSKTGRSNNSSGADPALPAGRVGFLDAFRLSIRPVHVRSDLAALPWIAVHTKAIWVPVLIIVGSTIATAVSGANDIVTGLLFTYFVVFPAIGGVFIGGFLAPRASWLVGIVIGLVSAICYVALGVTGLLPAIGQGTVSTFADQFAANPTSAAVSAFIYSPLMGAFFAAGAAWYRRFLALSSPNRGRQSQTPKQKPGDGRTRGGTTSQKAGVKR